MDSTGCQRPWSVGPAELETGSKIYSLRMVRAVLHGKRDSYWKSGRRGGTHATRSQRRPWGVCLEPLDLDWSAPLALEDLYLDLYMYVLLYACGR